MDAETKFTPGPWRLDTSLHVYAMVPSTNPDYPAGSLRSEHICSAKNFANAALIAAAPDLCDALSALVDQIDRNDFRDSVGHDVRMLAAFFDARAALAKARGEQ